MTTALRILSIGFYLSVPWLQRFVFEYLGWKNLASHAVVCYTAVFSVVKQRSLWGGALRDDTKNGYVADYPRRRS